MQVKRLIALLLVLVQSMLLGTAALADAPDDFGDGDTATPEEVAASTHTGSERASGGTTVSIIAIKNNSPQLSFTVPLYVTMAVIGKTNATGGDVYTPSGANYKIVNTSGNSDTKIGVIKIAVKGAGPATTADADNWTLTEGTPSGSTAMRLYMSASTSTTNALVMPRVARKDTTTAQVINSATLWTKKDSPFGAGGKPTLISPTDDGIRIQLIGQVGTNWKTNAKEFSATPMWIFYYTVAKMDADGNLLTAYTYAGNKTNYVWDGTKSSAQDAFR